MLSALGSQGHAFRSAPEPSQGRAFCRDIQGPCFTRRGRPRAMPSAPGPPRRHAVHACEGHPGAMLSATHGDRPGAVLSAPGPSWGQAFRSVPGPVCVGAIPTPRCPYALGPSQGHAFRKAPGPSRDHAFCTKASHAFRSGATPGPHFQKRGHPHVTLSRCTQSNPGPSRGHACRNALGPSRGHAFCTWALLGPCFSRTRAARAMSTFRGRAFRAENVPYDSAYHMPTRLICSTRLVVLSVPGPSEGHAFHPGAVLGPCFLGPSLASISSHL